MMSWAVNNIFQCMTCDHVGVMDLRLDVISGRTDWRGSGLTKILQKLTRTNRIRNNPL
jgi:hypothetical protein